MVSDEPPLWDPIAHDFERHAATSAYNAMYDRPAVVDLCGDLRGLKVFDVGCGPGLYAEEFVARGAAEVTGVDGSPAMVELARTRVPSGATFHTHDLESPLDWLEADSFDIAVMALVVHHIDDRVGVLREINRVLRPDGTLVVSTHHPTRDWMIHGGSYFDVSLVRETWKRGWDVRYWRLPLSQTVSEFSEAGFAIERLVEPLPLPEMAEQHPDDYKKLQAEPGFIAFRLVKRR